MQDEARDAAGRHPTIHALFDEQARRTPDAPALVQGSLQLSYAQLDERANRIAAHLLALGLRAQEPVGLFAGRTAQMVCGALGILRAGGCYVPIDPLLPVQRRRLIAQDCGLRFVLADAPDDEAGAYAPAALSVIDDLMQATVPQQALPQVQADHLAYVMYTSGSTGRPKGVMVTHGNVANLAHGNGYVPLEAGDRILMAGAVGFDAATFEVWGALLNGLALHLADHATLLDPGALRTALQDGGITTMILTTALCSRLAAADPTALGSLKYLLVGGDVLPPARWTALRAACPGLRLVNVYGPTENTTFSTTFEVDGEHPAGMPIGCALRGTSAHLVDEQDRVIDGPGTGELLVGGANLARGYWNLPQLTQERFVQHPVLGRVYRTGDLVQRRGDGLLAFIGRRDRQVKVGGYRVELGEIECALAAVPGVGDSAVRTWEAAQETFVAAYFVPAQADVQAAAVRRALAAVLPPWMVPTFVLALPAMPLTHNGKADLQALPDPFRARRAPDLQAGTERAAQVEAAILRIWQDVFGIAHIGLDDDFFELGGTSITAMHIFGRMSSRRQRMPVALSDILSQKTVRRLAAQVLSLQSAPAAGSWDAAAAGLQAAFAGTRFTFVRRVVDLPSGDGAPAERIVLHQDGPAVPPQAIVARLIADAAQDACPHYFATGTPAASAAQDFAAALGLRAAADLDLAALCDGVALQHRDNDRRLLAGRMHASHPFNAIQRLQYTFRTPPSLCPILLDQALDLGLLEQALQHLVRTQSLLRSVPRLQDGEWHWQEFDAADADAAPAIRPCMADVSGHLLSDDEFEAVAAALVESVAFDPAGLQYRIVVLKRDARRHLVLLCFHHVLFDRVSEEAIQRALHARYEALLAGTAQADAPPDAGFGQHVAQQRRGPQHCDAAQVIERYDLRGFFEAKQRIFQAPTVRKSDSSWTFQVAVDCPQVPPQQRPGVALSCYVRMVAGVFGLDTVPLLFIYDGRRYGGQDWYDLVGELIDYVPMPMQPSMPAPQMQALMADRLDHASRSNLNFLNLVNNPQAGGEWAEVRRLFDAGAGYANTDICMFNFLGNQDDGVPWRSRYREDVQRSANPLPLHSFLNCIAVSYQDGVVFDLRSSYEPQVERLREAALGLRLAP